MTVLYIIVALALLVSVLINRKKTLLALKIAVRKFLKTLPVVAVFIIAVAVFLFFFPEERIAAMLGEKNSFAGLAAASALGSVAFVPGFVVFPLCGLLRSQGVSYTMLSAFTTTLMMVGILSFGVEQDTLGTKLAVARNIAAFIMSLLVALITGLVFGEIPG